MDLLNIIMKITKGGTNGRDIISATKYGAIWDLQIYVKEPCGWEGLEIAKDLTGNDENDYWHIILCQEKEPCFYQVKCERVVNEKGNQTKGESVCMEKEV